MPDLIDAAETAIRDYILTEMGPDPSGELAQMDLAGLMTAYGVWRGRFVPARPRTVHMPAHLAGSADYARHKSAMDAIVGLIEQGGDLTPHLSRAVAVAYVPQASRGSKEYLRSDRDRMIADWGVHHFHLSTSVEADGFVTRSGDLLFAAFTWDDAYLIGIYPHGPWAASEVIETLVRNWPSAGLVRKLECLKPAPAPTTDDELLAMRKAGVMSVIGVDGGVWSPLGQTVAGTPRIVTSRVHQFLNCLAKWRKDTTALLAWAEHEVEKAGGVMPTGDWSMIVADGTLWLTRKTLRVPLFDFA